MSDFVPGFVSRHDAAAAALVEAFPLPDFVAGSVWRGAPAPANDPAPVGGHPGPRHFSPADPAKRPTAGWDPLNPNQPDHVPAAEAEAPADPFIDPLFEAHAAGYAEGLAAARAEAAAQAAARAAEAEAAAERNRALMQGLADKLGGAGRLDRERIGRQIRDTVLALTKKLVGEVGVAPDYLAHRIEAAADLLADTSEPALLRVHPDDVPLLDGRLPASMFAAGDASLQRGSFVLESQSTIVEDGPDLWLEQLAQAIDRAPMPPMGPPAC